MNAPIKNDDQQLIKTAVSFVELYSGMQIKTDEDAATASKIISDAKAQFKLVDARRKEITAPLDEAKKSTMELFRPATEACERIEKVLKLKISGFLEERREAQRQEEARLADIAAKEKAKLEAKAEKLREQGKEEQANAIEEKASTAVFISPAPVSKVEGISTIDKFEFEVTNLIDLLGLVISGELPPNVIKVDQGALNKIAQQWKGTKDFKGLKCIKSSTVRSY